MRSGVRCQEGAVYRLGNGQGPLQSRNEDAITQSLESFRNSQTVPPKQTKGRMIRVTMIKKEHPKKR